MNTTPASITPAPDAQHLTTVFEESGGQPLQDTAGSLEDNSIAPEQAPEPWEPEHDQETGTESLHPEDAEEVATLLSELDPAMVDGLASRAASLALTPGVTVEALGQQLALAAGSTDPKVAAGMTQAIEAHLRSVARFIASRGIDPGPLYDFAQRQQPELLARAIRGLHLAKSFDGFRSLVQAYQHGQQRQARIDQYGRKGR